MGKGHGFEEEVFVNIVESEPVIGGAGAVEGEKGDLLPVADDVDDNMFAIPDDDDEVGVDDQDGKDEEDDQDGADEQSDADVADVEAGWPRKSVGLPSTLPQIAWKYKKGKNIKKYGCE